MRGYKPSLVGINPRQIIELGSNINPTKVVPAPKEKERVSQMKFKIGPHTLRTRRD